jgi:hypothetical protein
MQERNPCCRFRELHFEKPNFQAIIRGTHPMDCALYYQANHQRGCVMTKTLTALAAAATMTVAAIAIPAPAQARGGRVAAGVIGGLAAGAIIGGAVAAPHYGYYYGGGPYYASGPYYGCGWHRERVWDGYRWRVHRVPNC